MITLDQDDLETLAICIRAAQTRRSQYATDQMEAVAVLNQAGLYWLVLKDAEESYVFYRQLKEQVLNESSEGSLS